MEVKVKQISTSSELPSYQSKNASGLDLYADCSEEITIAPKEVGLVSTGIAVEIPEKFEGQVRSRSGLALKHQIFVLNSPGTIDSDYRGEIKVILYNLSNKPYTINHHDRIAQLVFVPVVQCNLKVVDELSKTQRSSSGFGSTGVTKIA